MKRDLINFGKRVKVLRKGLNLTQVQLAATVDVDVRTIKSIEAGKSNVTLNLIYKLAEALEIHIKDLF